MHCWNESSQSVCVVTLLEEIRWKKAKMIFSIYSECRHYETLRNVILHWNWYRWDKVTFYYRTMYNCQDIRLEFESHIFCGCENPYLTDFLQQRLVWEALERQPLPKYGKLCHSGWKTWNIVLSHRQQISCCGLIPGSSHNSTALLRGIWIGCRFRPDEIRFVTHT